MKCTQEILQAVSGVLMFLRTVGAMSRSCMWVKVVPL